MKSNLYFRIAYQGARWLLVVLFLFSGFSKAINPFGLSLQFADYFAAMGLQFMQPFAPVAAIILPVAEMVLGVMIAGHLYRRFTAWATLCFMGFFTLLTLWIATTNPVSDCGCFGDLLIISNWATFFKNIVFTAAAIVLLRGRLAMPDRHNWQAVAGSALIIGVLPMYTYGALPLIDATPYKIGVNVYEELHRGGCDDTRTTLIYRDLQSGAEREFSIDDTTWHDNSRWQFVDQKTITLQKGEAPKIKSLPMIDPDGIDRSDSVLNAGGHTVIIVSANPSVITPIITEAIGRAKIAGADRIVLLHSSSRQITLPGVEVYISDFSTLHTMIQNRIGGVITLQQGVITEKRAL